MSSRKKSLGLPVVPRSYSLFLKPYDIDGTFDGSVVIHLDIVKDIKLMIMSGKNLQVKKANLRVSSSVIKPPIVTTLSDKELIFLEFGTVLKSGWAVLSIHYTGLINDGMIGLFKTNQEHYAAATIGRPLLARNLFPCWDNPAIKAHFEISLCGNYRAVLSNMPAESTEDQSEAMVVKFESSQPMSVDQVSIAFGNYGFIESNFKNVAVRVYTEPYQMELGRYTLDCLVKLIRTFSTSFDLQFPLPKLDAVIMDEAGFDFSESWGLLILPSRCALVKSHQSLIGKKTLLKVLSECVARQWIGNLVTANKLDEHWVLKGCAKFIGLKICNLVQPDLKPLLWFHLDDREYVLTSYSRGNLRSEQQKFVNEDQFKIKKMASLCSMLDSYIGEDKLKHWVKFFIQKFRHSGIVMEQFWSSMEISFKMKLTDNMTNWMCRDNYPLIIVKNIYNEGLDKIVEIEQEPFYNLGIEASWGIPITFVKSKQPNKQFFQAFVTQPEAKIRLPNVGRTSWVKLNSKSMGLYRVLYPKGIMQEFINDYLSKAMHVDDRIGIISDLRALVLSGREKTSTLLSFISQLGDEDAQVWWIIIAFFEDLFVIIPRTKSEQGFREYGLTVFKKIYNNLGWYSKKKENPMETMLRPLVLKLYCRFGDSDALIESKKRFLGLVLEKEEIEEDLLVPVLYGCARIGGEKEFSQLLELYNNAILESERDKIIEGMCGFQNMDCMIKLINFLTDEKRKISILRYLQLMASNEIGAKLVWDYVKTNWKDIEAKFSNNVTVLSDLITTIICHWPCNENDEEIVSFGMSVANSLPTVVEDGLGKFKIYRNWVNRDCLNIDRFFIPWATSISS